LSPDGKKIVFDSNRLTGGMVCNGSFIVGDLFLMNTDGTEQTLLTRGDSASWSPDGKTIAFHASASYYASGGLETGCPIVPFPGGAASDSDIFVVNVDDLLAETEQPTNITNSSNKIDDDADWSPDGQKLVFTNRDANDPDQLNPLSAEIYVMNVDDKGLPTGAPERLTFNDYEERGPAWSPDNSKIVYSCRVGPVNPSVGYKSFRICVINADGTGWQQLTNEEDSLSDLTATWSPDGSQIVFHRTPRNQLFSMTQNPDGTWTAPTQLTSPPGINLLAHWGELRVET
jgi:Tol biopolymer transport system component